MSFVWKPFLKQERFLALPLSVKEGFYAGAVNAGKSDVLLMYPAVYGWLRNGNFKGIFLRRTLTELKKEIIPRSKEYFIPLGGKFNETDKFWKFPSGAIFQFGHVENEKDVHNYDSAQYNYAAFDELTSFTLWQYLYITIERVRRPNKDGYRDLPAIVRSASNPGNIGHVWVRKRFIDPCPQGEKLIIGKGNVKRVYIPATIEDNPYADETYKAELEALPEAEKRAKKYGDWSAYEGQVFDEFRDKHYPSEPDNALHVIEPFTIPAFWPRLLAIDWGFSAMTYVAHAAVSPEKRLYLYHEQSFVQEQIAEWGTKVKYYTDKEPPTDAVICHSAGQHRGEPHTIQEQVESATGITFRLSEKDRVAGKMMIHEYLRFKAKALPPQTSLIYNESEAMWYLRNRGMKEYQSYLKQFEQPVPESNLPKLQIFSGCSLVQKALKACIYDSKNVEDVKEFAGDDPYDCLRYLCMSADLFFEQAGDAQIKLMKQQELLDNLIKTQDMTAFYRNARRLETAETAAPVLARGGKRKGFYGSYSRSIH